MNYDALMAFGVFAEYLNFTHAAHALHITQPALHAKVKRLSEELGELLYVRRGRNLVLTEAGEVLAAHARQIASQTEDVLARIHDPDARGPVTLAAGHAILLHLLGRSIERLHKLARPIHYKVGPRAAQAVLDAHAHLAVTVFSEQEQEALEVSTLCEISPVVLLPHDHELVRSGKKILVPEDLDGESFVIGASGGHRAEIARVLEEHGVSWSVGTLAMGWEFVARLVSYGAGIAIVNDVVPEIEGVVAVPVRGFTPVTYGIGMLPGEVHPGALWLRDFLLEHRPQSSSGGFIRSKP